MIQMQQTPPSTGPNACTERQVAEHALIRRAQSGDVAAFEEIVCAYESVIFSLLARWLRDRALVEDVFQQTLLKAFVGLPRFAPDSSFRNWLCRIAVNTAKDELRARRRRVDRESAWTDVVTEMTNPSGSDRYDATLVLERALAEVSPSERLLLLLRFGQEMSLREVAKAAGMPFLVVPMRLHRARKRFRGIVRRLESGDSR
jgi:RNA polymerase sigma-70 factor, ECF subfamily